MKAIGQWSRVGRFGRTSGCALALLIGIAGPSFAGANRWTSSGPADAVISLAIDPTNPQIVYAGSVQTGLLQTVNGGRSWRISSGVSGYVSAIAVDPGTPEIVYAATQDGLLKSTDAGISWDRSLPGLRLPSSATVFSLTIDPADPSVVYAGSDVGLFRSADAGLNWTSNQYFEALYVSSLLFDPLKPSKLYASDLESDFDYSLFSPVSTSTDDGKTWKKSGTVPGGVNPGAFVIDPLNPSTFFAGVANGHQENPAGFYKSTDGGATWFLASTDLELSSALVIDPTNPATLYAGTFDNGVYRSTDGGSTWAPFGLTGLKVWTLASDRTGARLYAGTDSGVFDYQIPRGAADLSVGPDNQTRILSDDRQGSAHFRNIDGSGRSSDASYGPYGGWTATAVADGADGLTRVLWNNLDGSAALWLLGSQGNQASYRLDAASGFHAIDVSASAAGLTHILWTASDGRIAITSVDNAGHVSTGPANGPFFGWTAVAIFDGPDGLTRVLWNDLDGRAAISFARAGSLLASYSYGAAAGWTALDVAAGGDGLTRILWSHLDGRIALGIIDSSGQVKYGPVYPAPEGMSAIRIATGPDSSSQVLFTDFSSSAILWQMSADGVFVESVVASEAPPSGGISGAWTGTYNGISYQCDSDARASFNQSGSGTLTTTGSCGETFYIDSTLQGNTLAGTITDRDTLLGRVLGTLSGSTLEITIDNGSGFTIAQVHLHR